MKKLLLLFILLIITSTAFSQTVSLIITGDNKPVEAVHVIKSNQVIAVTDSLGLVSIPAVEGVTRNLYTGLMLSEGIRSILYSRGRSISPLVTSTF